MQKLKILLRKGYEMEKEINGVFIKRKITYTLVLLCVVIMYLFAARKTEFHLGEGLSSFKNAIQWMAGNLRIDQKAMEQFSKVISKLAETALLAVAVTVVASIFAFIASLYGSRATGISGWINRIVRIFAAFFRNVPDVVWAMLLMFSFGQNILTGFFALFFTTFGMLTRAFIENIDEVSADCIEALHSTGANFAETVCQGIIPSMLTSIISWVLYMIETNIRSSTLIGILTATGIGYLFDLYYKRMEFSVVSLIVVATIVMVIGIEIISNVVRKVIM